VEQTIITEQEIPTPGRLATGRLTPRQLAAQVRRLTASQAEWVARVRLDPEGRWYERIHLANDLEVWLISWLPGQSTGFHDHGASAGAFGVVWGALEESVATRRGAAQRVTQVAAGDVKAFGPRYVHDVRNSSGGSVAVSVHAYSPPLSAMTRYDLVSTGLKVTGTEGAGDW
jgi:predicted metal-dependent enzyme (double-stranded beta helix superfamily)